LLHDALALGHEGRVNRNGGMIVGVLLVRSEAKRARRRWREAMRTWHEIDAVELRGEHNNLPRHNTAISGQAADQR